jgi:pimeloyl-ACP methyl ester carboxylesterase
MSLGQDVAARFDIVGFDPRGAGDSAPLNCHTHLQEMYDADPTMEDGADRSHYLDVSGDYVDECERNDGRELPHLGTLNVARDLDEWRKAVGDEKLTYVGYSYGTSIGQMYAQLFPTKIRAMVLDGVVDTEQGGLEGADVQASGFERALRAFYDDCEQDPTCAIGPDPEAVTKRVIAKAEKTPIPAAHADRPAGPGVIQLGIGQALYAKALWTTLSDALNQADHGDGTGLVQLADEYMQRQPDGQYPNTFDVYFAVSCLDSEWPTDPDAVFAAAKRTGRKYPTLGEGLVNDYVRCALWPEKPQPLPKLTAKGSPPILVISTTRDPATPYENGVKVAKRLPEGVLLTNEGDGHTIFGQGKACIDDAVATYLVDLEPPKDGTRCD